MNREASAAFIALTMARAGRSGSEIASRLNEVFKTKERNEALKMTANLTREVKLKLHEWSKLAEELKELKQKESELRDELVDAVFPNATEGTNRIELGEGYSLVCVQSYTRELDEDELKKVLKELPKELKGKLVKTSVSLIKSGYNELDKEQRDIFDRCVTVKPSKPSLKIEAPKKKE